MVGQSHFLFLAVILFVIGVFGLFWRRHNVIALFMCLEIMLLAASLTFVTFAAFAGDLAGQVFVLFILTVAAAESAIGLAILLLFFRAKNSIAVQDLCALRG